MESRDLRNIPNHNIGYSNLKDILSFVDDLLNVVVKHGGIRHLLDNADDTTMTYREFQQLIEHKETIDELKVILDLIDD